MSCDMLRPEMSKFGIGIWLAPYFEFNMPSLMTIETENLIAKTLSP